MLPSCVTAMLSVDSSTYSTTASPFAASGWLATMAACAAIVGVSTRTGLILASSSTFKCSRSSSQEAAATSSDLLPARGRQHGADLGDDVLRRDREAVVQAGVSPAADCSSPAASVSTSAKKKIVMGQRDRHVGPRVESVLLRQRAQNPRQASPCCGGPGSRMSSPGEDLPASGPFARRGRGSVRYRFRCTSWAFACLGPGSSPPSAAGTPGSDVWRNVRSMFWRGIAGRNVLGEPGYSGFVPTSCPAGRRSCEEPFSSGMWT